MRYLLNRPWSPEEDAALIALLAQPPVLTARLIARKLKRTQNSVRSCVTHLGISLSNRHAQQPP
jgi:hypothetical protein